MKKIWTLLPALCVFFFSFGQQLTNGGFEAWTNGNPDGWGTSHSAISSTTLETKETTSFYEGTAAIKMVSGNVGAPLGLPYSGFAHYGSAYYDASIGDIRMPQVAFAYRPDSISFAYRYTPSGNDSGALQLSFTKGSIGSLLANVTLGLHTSATYKVVTVPIHFSTSQVPDSMSLNFQSSFDLLNPTTGSTLYIDAVKFIYKSGSSTGIETTTIINEIHSYPNPATERLNLMLPENHAATDCFIYDIVGNQIKHSAVNDVHVNIELSNMSTGIYLYRINDREGHCLHTGKFQKQ